MKNNWKGTNWTIENKYFKKECMPKRCSNMQDRTFMGFLLLPHLWLKVFFACWSKRQFQDFVLSLYVSILLVHLAPGASFIIDTSHLVTFGSSAVNTINRFLDENYELKMLRNIQINHVLPELSNWLTGNSSIVTAQLNLNMSWC